MSTSNTVNLNSWVGLIFFISHWLWDRVVVYKLYCTFYIKGSINTSMLKSKDETWVFWGCGVGLQVACGVYYVVVGVSLLFFSLLFFIFVFLFVLRKVFVQRDIVNYCSLRRDSNHRSIENGSSILHLSYFACCLYEINLYQITIYVHKSLDFDRCCTHVSSQLNFTDRQQFQQNAVYE